MFDDHDEHQHHGSLEDTSLLLLHVEGPVYLMSCGEATRQELLYINPGVFYMYSFKHTFPHFAPILVARIVWRACWNDLPRLTRLSSNFPGGGSPTSFRAQTPRQLASSFRLFLWKPYPSTQYSSPRPEAARFSRRSPDLSSDPSPRQMYEPSVGTTCPPYNRSPSNPTSCSL